jgi:subtilase family serine protease
MVADVSAVADPATGVAVYDTYINPGWLVFGGTSASAPIVGAVYALAANTANIIYGSYPYSHTNGLYDVITGNNGTCSPSYFCTAGAGYDGPTGLGTPNGTGALGSSIQGAISLAGGAMLESLEPGPAERLCSDPPPGYAACHALVRTDIP